MEKDIETLLSQSPDQAKRLIDELHEKQGTLKLALAQGMEPMQYKQNQALVEAYQAAISIIEKTDIKSNQTQF